MIPLKRTEFGNPILREKARDLSSSEIKSAKIQKLVKDMKQTLQALKLGVGLAAPQIGEGIALSVIVVQPTKLRPDVEPFELVIINPIITETFGRKQQLWEGCISGGSSRAGLFAKVPRYKKIKLKFVDEKNTLRHEVFSSLPAQVIQHEVDHLNGVLFVDRVRDTQTYMTYHEYMRLKNR